jgi:hypothetical protein
LFLGHCIYDVSLDFVDLKVKNDPKKMQESVTWYWWRNHFSMPQALWLKELDACKKLKGS